MVRGASVDCRGPGGALEGPGLDMANLSFDNFLPRARCIYWVGFFTAPLKKIMHGKLAKIHFNLASIIFFVLLRGLPVKKTP